jgi:4-hydroxy 2-oxovalerate aldolase
MEQSEVHILDCTLRDAGYPINFQFTSCDIQKISSNLEKSGVALIEVGHGLGVGADKNCQLKKSLVANDLAVHVAKDAVKNAKIGLFYIPGIGTIEEVKSAVGNGLDFLRVGYDAKKIENVLPDLEKLCNLNLSISVNLMKSNEISVKELNSKLLELAGFPIKVLSIVDSSGSMLPVEVSEMVRMVHAMGMQAGFHGHDNIGTALANCLAAIEGGATYIDTTITGLGRSLGNAKTEQIAILLSKKQISKKYNLINLLNLAEAFSRKFCTSLLDVDQVLMGYAQLHSGFEADVKKLCRSYDISMRKFLFETGKRHPTQLKPKLALELSKYDLKKYDREVEISWRSEDFSDFIDNLNARARMSENKVIVVVHYNKVFTKKFSNEYKIRGIFIYHVQIESNQELKELYALKKQDIVNIYYNKNINQLKDLKILIKDSYLPSDDKFENLLIKEILECHEDALVSINKKSKNKLLDTCEKHNRLVKENKTPVKRIQIISEDLDFELSKKTFYDIRYIINRFLLSVDLKTDISDYKDNIRIIDITDLTNFWVANHLLNKQKIRILKYSENFLDHKGGEKVVLQGMLGAQGDKVIDVFSPDLDNVIGIADGKGGII